MAQNKESKSLLENSATWTVILALPVLKLLLIRCYTSTDFEV